MAEIEIDASKIVAFIFIHPGKKSGTIVVECNYCSAGSSEVYSGSPNNLVTTDWLAKITEHIFDKHEVLYHKMDSLR